MNTGAFTPAPAPVAEPAGPPVPQYQQQYAAPQQQYAAPAQQYAAPEHVPGAPLVNGQPAKLIKGSKNGRDWQAWGDPRPKAVTEGMQRTEDPHHPGIAGGTHQLWKWIR